MRSPSAEQKEGDLDRLTTSASIRSNVSSNSAQTVIKASFQPAPARHQYSNINDDNNNSSSNNYLPNIIIASCAEYQQQCRKRKDRHDSVSSSLQERKLVRSNSEEHVADASGAQNESMRRVASHDDIKHHRPQPLHEHNENDEDLEALEKEKLSFDVNSSQNFHHHLTHHEEHNDENEQRRHSERFLKTKSPSGRKSPRKPSSSRKSSPTPYLDWDDSGSNVRENIAKIVEEMKEPAEPTQRSLLPWENFDEPVVCQRFAENTFDHVHHSITKFIKHDHDLVNKYHLNSEEATPTEKKQFSHFAPESSALLKAHPTKSHSPVGNNYQYQTPDERIRQINKRLSSLKRKIAAYEENFESSYGYRPSQADKTNDKHIKNYSAEIHKLRKEKSQIKADPMTAMGYKNKFDDSERRLVKIQETLEDIEKRLQEKREEESRPLPIVDLSSEQLNEEKSSVQRALLYFESIFGRPSTAEERDAARPLYDRYRLLKRLVSRNNSITGGGGFELPTILENEALALSGMVSPSNDFSPPAGNSQIQSPVSDSSTSTSIEGIPVAVANNNNNALNENLNVSLMNVQELYAHYNVVREEKKQLRRTIKEFEHNFEEVNGRKMLKTDRNSIEDTYAAYKQKKAKLRLLDALVRKQTANCEP